MNHMVTTDVVGLYPKIPHGAGLEGSKYSYNYKGF